MLAQAALGLGLRYKLSKKVYLEAASSIASSLDIFYKRDFQGGSRSMQNPCGEGACPRWGAQRP